MKKVLLLSVFALFLVVGMKANAADGSVAGGFEASGNVDVVTAYLHADKDAAAAGNAGSVVGEFLGGNGGGNRDVYQTFIDQVELDIGKTFGENIRLRADIDFQSTPESGAFISAGGANVNLEQAYVTTNIALGDGVELLIGKFNTPIGFDTVDRATLYTVSHSNIFNFLTPVNTTGFKVYAAGEHIDFHLYIVNELGAGGAIGVPGGVGSDSAYPSGGARLGFNWGEEDAPSTVGLSVAGGPENANQNMHFDYLVDVDFGIHLTDALLIGGEVTGRQSNAVGGGDDSRAAGGQLLLNYAFSDVWDGTFRADYLWVNEAADITENADFTFIEEQLYAVTLAAGYQITDDAKAKAEYRFEYADPVANSNNSDYHSVALEMAYNF